jgi:hypothetical protein
MTKAIKILVLIFITQTEKVAFAQCPVMEMKTLDQQFSIVDSAVWLIEKYDPIKLTSLTTQTEEGQNKRSLRKMVEVNFCDASCNVDGSINALIKCHVLRLCKKINLNWPTSTQVAFKNLYHHTLTLFHNDHVSGGKDFDENLLSIYHQYRIQLIQLIEIEQGKCDLALITNQIGHQIDQINQSLIELNGKIEKEKRQLEATSLKLTSNSKVLSEEQKRNRLINQYFRNNKRRYQAQILPVDFLEKASQMSYRKGKKEIKNAIKNPVLIKPDSTNQIAQR